MRIDQEQSLHWQASNPSRNVARGYHIWIKIDLFGWTTVERRWGRIGTNGQCIIESFHDQAQALQLVRKVQQKRENAIKKIGVNYHTI